MIYYGSDPHKYVAELFSACTSEKTCYAVTWADEERSSVENLVKSINVDLFVKPYDVLGTSSCTTNRSARSIIYG